MLIALIQSKWDAGLQTVLGPSAGRRNILRKANRCADNKTMKILIVDDHPIYRKGLVALLDHMERDTVLLQANDGAQALVLIAEHDDLDVVILDLVIPGMDGLRAIAEFGKIRPELPVIILSSSENTADVRAALANGALGYVPKSAAEHTLLTAIRVVLNGDIYVPPFVLLQAESAHPAGLKIESGLDRPVLTDRQIEVLRRISAGQLNKIIAVELGLSEKTVKSHITAIFRALNVVNRSQAAAVAREAGFI
jgi:two-component system, NarL family, nitrate/nitrite response regulator NarL